METIDILLYGLCIYEISDKFWNFSLLRLYLQLPSICVSGILGTSVVGLKSSSSNNPESNQKEIQVKTINNHVICQNFKMGYYSEILIRKSNM